MSQIGWTTDWPVLGGSARKAAFHLANELGSFAPPIPPLSKIYQRPKTSHSVEQIAQLPLTLCQTGSSKPSVVLLRSFLRMPEPKSPVIPSESNKDKLYSVCCIIVAR